MLKVALTGGIATGKSYVLDRFRRYGVPCLDADVLAHGATETGTEATAAIAARFGPLVLQPDGSIDRKALGAIVFEDETARRALEAIVHPAVYRSVAAGLRAFELIGSQVAIVDVPLLYETGHEGDFDRVIVTACSIDQQVQRLLARGMSELEARRRLSAQLPTEDKAARADYVIRTDGSLEETNRQVQGVLEELRDEAIR
jgi:dephospho-CoA kinase